MITGIKSPLASMLSRMSFSSTSADSSRMVKDLTLPAAANSSTQVTFGSQTESIASTYNLSPKKISATATDQASDVIQSLMQNAQENDSINGFSGLGSALLNNLKDNRADFTQAIAGSDLGAYSTRKSAVSLSITTQSGTTVRLSLARQNDGIAVSVKTEGGELTDAEAEAIGELGKAFQSALDGLGGETPKLDIGDLTKFDSTLLKSVDLKTDVRQSDNSTQSLNFYADDTKRYVAYQDLDFSLKLTSDRSTLTGGSLLEQEMALKAYDKQFDQARIDGHGDRNQMDMLKSAFHALNTTQPTTTPTLPDTTVVRVGANAKPQFGGLNDFSLSLTQAEKSINPSRMGEKVSFSYQASQTTSETEESDGSRSLKQTTQNRLSASWYQPLDPSIPLSLGTTKASQNYVYHTLERDEVNSTTMNFDNKGVLASIKNESQLNKLETMKKYVMGVLEDKSETPEKYKRESFMDLLGNK